MNKESTIKKIVNAWTWYTQNGMDIKADHLLVHLRSELDKLDPEENAISIPRSLIEDYRKASNELEIKIVQEGNKRFAHLDLIQTKHDLRDQILRIALGQL